MTDYGTKLRQLRDLIEDAREEFYSDTATTCDYHTYIADRLMYNGVILPPCKLGDKVWYYDYVPTTKGLERIIRLSEVSQITIDSHCSFVTLVNCLSLALENFGKTVFLTREEAEAALEKLRTEVNDDR